MRTEEYQRIHDLEETYWWHVGRKSVVRSILNKLTKSDPRLKILNVGSGTGGTIPLLREFGKVTNLDPSLEAIQYCVQKGYRGVVRSLGENLPFKKESFDLVVALDVLEHIEDDEAALDEWMRVLKPGGRMFLTVPAYQWLWSSHDESLHHFRRYTASGLHKLMNMVGAKVVERSYAIVFSFPLILAYRFLTSVLPLKRSSKPRSSYVILPKIFNSLLVQLLRVEALVLRVMNFPFGTSVAMAAQKPSQPAEIFFLEEHAAQRAHKKHQEEERKRQVGDIVRYSLKC